MSNGNNKRIAQIFEEEQVFLTKSGCFYGYENVDGTFKCHRLNTLEIHRFLYRMKGVKKDIAFFSSSAGVKKPLPRKFEEPALKEM